MLFGGGCRRQRLLPEGGVMGVVDKVAVGIGSIVINCDEFARMMAFWQEALRYAPREPPTPGDPLIILRDPAGKRPNVSIDFHGVRAFQGATGNLVRSNEIVGNKNGIGFVGPAGTPEALANMFLRNTIEENECGVKGSASELSGNMFLRNVFEANAADTCTE